MAQFKLDWINTFVNASPNATAQRASYRRKSVGGAFITTGFTPVNNLPKTANTVNSPVLLDNVIYEFKIEAICTANGPTINDNGIQEAIAFSCITPSITKTENTSDITVNTTGTDITKVRFTLRRASDNTVAMPATTVNVVSNSATIQATGLVSTTNYYWQIELIATINNVEVISSSSDFLGSICSPYVFTTNAPTICDPITSVVVSSIEII